MDDGDCCNPRPLRPCCPGCLNTYTTQIIIRIVEILSISGALACVIYGYPTCPTSSGTCPFPATVWPSNWNDQQFNGKLYGQYFVLIASSVMIIGFLLQIVFYSILKQWPKKVCCVICMVNAILTTTCMGLEVWYASGISSSIEIGHSTINQSIYVGSYIGAYIIYAIMLIFLFCDFLMTKKGLVFQWLRIPISC